MISFAVLRARLIPKPDFEYPLYSVRIDESYAAEPRAAEEKGPERRYLTLRFDPNYLRLSMSLSSA